MGAVGAIIREMVEEYGYSIDTLATEIGTTPAALKRYMNDVSAPRATVEGHIRRAYTRYQTKRRDKEVMALPLIRDEMYVRASIDEALRELREIMHRRGRLSSRAQALDEVSKLLFAHIMSVMQEGIGISMASVLSDSAKMAGTAVALKAFVHNVFDTHLPASLSHEVNPDDFALTLKPQEDVLASEIIRCFERLALHGLTIQDGRIGDLDILNDVFGKFLADSFIDEKELGQYLTPIEVVKFMVCLAVKDMTAAELDVLCHPERCSDFGLILDPSCGTGSFLTELLKTLQEEVVRRHGAIAARGWVERMVSDVVVGIDKSERMVKLALTSTALFGLPAAKLHLANSLGRTGRDADVTSSLEGRVHLILTNPPFGAEFEGSDLNSYKIATTWSRHPQRSVVSELLFMERYLDWLMPGGRCIAVAPDSILTNKGMYDDLRRNVADKIELRGVVSLPAVTFGAAGTTTKTSIVHLRKHNGEYPDSARTFFAMCRDIGYTVTTKAAQRTKVSTAEGSDLPLILRRFAHMDEDPEYGRWVDGVTGCDRWDATYHASLPIGIERRLKQPKPTDLFVQDVADLSADKEDPRRWGSDTFEYIEISDVDPRTCMVHTKSIPCDEAPSRARKLVRTGDVLVSTVRPERRTVGVVREDQDGAICTTGFAVLRPRAIHPLILAYLLKSDVATAQILRQNIGIAYPAIEEQCLLSILLPVGKDDLTSFEVRARIVLSLEQEFQALRREFAQDVHGLVHVGMSTS